MVPGRNADAPALPRNFVDNPIVVQFVHRWLAFVVAAAHRCSRCKPGSRGHPRPPPLVATVPVQILLGIATLLSGVELWIAVAHQAMAALLLAAIVVAAHRWAARRRRA
jgi:cytochrome c oxidase assembly protein subunit 15